MGYNNRDYMQDDPDSQGPTWGSDVPTTKWLIIVTVIVFFLQTLAVHRVVFNNPQAFASLMPDGERSPVFTVQNVSMQVPVLIVSYVEEWCFLDAGKVLKGQVWRLVTHAFCHERSQPFSLAISMLLLWSLGSALERLYGSREILFFYLAAAVVSGLVFVAFGLQLDLTAPTYSSGPSIMALFTLFVMHFPREEFRIYFLIPIQAQVLYWVYITCYVYVVFQASVGQAAWGHVAYLTQLWSAAFAYSYYHFHWRLAGFVDYLDVQKLRRSMRQMSTRSSLKVVRSEPISDLDEQVDAILAKIHEQGSESLTDRERAILQKASERAKSRP